MRHEAEEFLFASPQKLSVARGLFQGKFIADWVTPYPKLPEVESLPAIRKFLDEFPTTVTGKIQKYKMREISPAELAQERTLKS